MNDFTVKIKPLTPIWTGDSEKKNDVLRETGILGSLRWWYEALIRGLGGTACDPTNTACNDETHCDACELFGCTGWARKFKLEIKGGEKIDQIKIGTRKKHKGKNNTFYHLTRSVDGFMAKESILFTFIPLRNISNSEWFLLNSTLKIIENFGAIGAHTSQGNGVIKIIENNLPSYNEVFSPVKFKEDKSKNQLINLNDFFFYKYQLEFKRDISKLIQNQIFWTHDPEHDNFRDNWDVWKNYWDCYDFLPITFHIRDALRPLEDNRERRHSMFGTGGRNATGSKIFVSHGYRIDPKTVEIRIWGYNNDEKLKNKIKNELETRIINYLFSSKETTDNILENCVLIKETEGKELVGGLQ